MGDEQRVLGAVVEKVIRPEIRSLNEDAGSFDAVLSTESKDGDGDIIRQSGWDLKRFKSHPVMLDSHSYGSVLKQIGHWQGAKVASKELSATGVIYHGKGNQAADWAWELAKMGRLAFSVGFIPDFEKAAPLDSNDPWFGGYEFKGQELLEVSAVTVPSNADALMRMKGFEGLSPVVLGIIDEQLKDAKPDDAAKQLSPDELAEAIAEKLADRIGRQLADLVAEAVKDLNGPTEPREPESPREPEARMIAPVKIDYAELARRAFTTS